MQEVDHFYPDSQWQLGAIYDGSVRLSASKQIALKTCLSAGWRPFAMHSRPELNNQLSMSKPRLSIQASHLDKLTLIPSSTNGLIEAKAPDEEVSLYLTHLSSPCEVFLAMYRVLITSAQVKIHWRVSCFAFKDTCHVCSLSLWAQS